MNGMFQCARRNGKANCILRRRGIREQIQRQGRSHHRALRSGLLQRFHGSEEGGNLLPVLPRGRESRALELRGRPRVHDGGHHQSRARYGHRAAYRR